MFEGDRDKSEVFTDEWNFYYLNNCFYITMATPYQCVTQCLTHNSEPKVANWKKMQVEWLNDITTRQINLVPINNPWLWNTFCDEFTHAFADTMEKEQAERKLQDLYIKGSKINKYICDFEDLIRKARRTRNNKAMVQLFRQGLNQKLHKAIWEQVHLRPKTLDQWITGAREQ
jgi:Retrotransposon gag protein